MTKALKIVMIVFGAILVLVGLVNILFPGQWGEMHGMQEGPGYLMWIAALMGVISITVGVWIIIAGRDPLRDINWVKFAITWCILALVIHIYSIIKGYVDFNQVVGFVIIDAVFAILFLALYPWRRARK